MSVLAICASHTPLKDHSEPGPGVRAAVDACFEQLRDRVVAFAPELLVVFGPDHFNGFFHRLMPSFCIGAMAESIGDWNTPSGPLPCAPALAVRAAEHAHQRGVDLAVSWRMEVDHGLTQTTQMLVDWDQLPPMLPIFINCVGAPRPPLKRVEALGRAVGEFLGTLDQRVLLLGSGGISHDPPVPALDTAAPEVRERLIGGGAVSREARAARQARVLEDARGQVAGTSNGVPLNPAWDHDFLAALLAQDFGRLTAYDDAGISRDGGRGGHEIRTWIAVAAAMSALGARPPKLEFYAPIAEWVAGFGVVSQGPVGA